jgi:hypothetical protein
MVLALFPEILAPDLNLAVAHRYHARIPPFPHSTIPAFHHSRKKL